MTQQDNPRVATAACPPASLEDTVARIVSEHGAAMHAYATRITNDQAEAEEIMEEALVRAWRDWARLDQGHSALRGWLLFTVRHLATANGAARAARSSAVPAVDSDGSQQANLELNERHAEVIDLVARLSPEQRSVLTDMHLRNRSVRQVAEALGISRRAVAARALRALRQLRQVHDQRASWSAGRS